MHPTDAHASRTLLFIAPGFLSYRVHKHVRGVQVFDVQLIRRLVGMGIRVSVAAESSWKPRMNDLLGDLARAGAIEFIWTPTLRKPLWNGLYLAAKLRFSGRRWDAMYVGNAGEGLATAVGALMRCGVAPRFTLMAHRHPKRRMAALVKRWPCRCVAVSGTVECMFPRDLVPPAEIYFGEMDHEMFTPAPDAQRAERASDGLVHFAMLGALDTPLKDVPTAIRAFTMLPDDVRARCRLHLASFAEPPRDMPQGVTAYPWMPLSEVPAFLRSKDVLLVTSLSETFCLALVQGMLCELPAVVREMGTLTDKTSPGGGLSFTTVEELRDHMLALASDPARRREMGRVARRTAIERFIFDTPRFVDRYVFPPEIAPK